MRRLLKIALCGVTLLISTIIAGASFAQNWPNSPNNWQNSPNNWQNNPNNWQNNSNNFNSQNGIYDNEGNRLGYAVPRADGSGVNIFKDDGDHLGYQNYGD